MCMRGRTPGNVDVWKRVTLIGDGADVCSCEPRCSGGGAKRDRVVARVRGV
jgi:hypothetical protein